MAIPVLARWARISLWICLAGVLAACAGPTTIPTTPQSSAAPLPAGERSSDAIQFMASGSGALLEAYQALASLYQQRHHDRSVAVVGIPGEADFQKRLAADIAAGRPADVIVESYTNVPGLVARGL